MSAPSSRTVLAVSVLPAVLAVTVLAGCSGSSGTSVDLGATTPDPTPTAVVASPSEVSASPSEAGVAALKVTLTRTSPDGARAVAVSAVIAGLVPQVLDGTGVPLAAAQTEVMGTRVAWGDGALDGSDAGDVTCSAKGTLVKLSETFDLSHTYAKPGTYTMSFTAGACAPLKDVTRKVTITVR